MRVIAIFLTILAVSLAAPSELGSYSGEADAPKKVEKFSLDDPRLQDESIQLEKKAEPINENPLEAEVKTQEAPEVVAPADQEKNDDDVSDDNKTPNGNIDDNRDLCRETTGVTLMQVATFGENLADDAPQEMKCYVRCLQEWAGNFDRQFDAMFEKTIELVDENNREDAFKICDSLVADDPCHSSYLKLICYASAAK